jgi:hypothetical protein
MSSLEDEIVLPRDTGGPRASLVLAAAELPGLTASIWMGGARSLRGDVLDEDRLAHAVVIDCAGDMPRDYRDAAANWQACVFVDHDGPVAAMHRLNDIARQVAAIARDGRQTDIDAIYVMCTHGMNRSGLVTGLILRELGVSPAEAIRRISAARPGALSNQWFRRLLEQG